MWPPLAAITRSNRKFSQYILTNPILIPSSIEKCPEYPLQVATSPC